MKKIITGIAALMLLFSVSAYAQGMNGEHKAEHKAEAGKTMTVQGEIVDMGCYLSHGAKGKDHQSCALKCVANGMPMGLLTEDGSLYLLTVSHDNADPFNQAKKMAAEQVSVTGHSMDRNGMIALEVDQVKQLSGEKPAK